MIFVFVESDFCPDFWSTNNKSRTFSNKSNVVEDSFMRVGISLRVGKFQFPNYKLSHSEGGFPLHIKMYTDHKYVQFTMIGYENVNHCSIYAPMSIKIIKKEIIFINRDINDITKTLYLKEIMNKYIIVNGIRNRLSHNNESNIKYKLYDILSEMRIEFDYLNEKDSVSLNIFDSVMALELLNGIDFKKWNELFDQIKVKMKPIRYSETVIETIDLKAIEDQYDIDLSEE